MRSSKATLDKKSLWCTFEINGRYFGKVEIDNRIFTFGEVTKISKDKYQIVPIDEKYRNNLSSLTDSEKNEIGKNKVSATIDGEKYEGLVIIVDGKKVSICDTRIVPDLSEYEFALKKFEKNNKNSKSDTHRLNHKKDKTSSPQNFKHTTLFSIPSINASDSTSEEIARDIQKRSREQLEELDKVHKKELKELMNNPNQNISNTSVFVGGHFSPRINLAELVKQLREDKKVESKHVSKP